ncbi:MAG: YegS/Rv2252/BmrU family lipid kinase [Actinomycetota bacterium]|nr:YegS/Rv2252/BmrU family lipid kinase [Actinomycetota bacterium]
MTWYGVVNPSSGRAGSVFEEVVTTAKELRVDAVFIESQSGDHVTHLVADAVADGFRHFISVGGDGTAHLVLNGFMATGSGEGCSLAIVPAGSGSDFVRTFGHKRGIHAGLSRLTEPEPYVVDIGRVTGSFGTRYFLNALNLGVAAASASIATRLPRWMGSTRYSAAFWIALWKFHSAGVTATIDQHRYEGEAINIVVANGQFFGGGMNVAPRSSLVDGKMDVQVFKGPRRQAFSVMPRVMRGTHLTHRGVQRYSGTAIRVEVPSEWPVEADGETLGSGSVEIEVLSGAIRFII